ncbi:hypothetical protein CR513_06236, partial [Mucuna pruriens]
MDKFQAVHKYFFIFLALVACYGSLVAHGRKIKPLNQHSSLNTNTVVANNPHPSLPWLKTNYEESSSLEDSGAGYTDAFRPTTPGESPGVGHGIVTSEHNKVKTMVAVKSPNVQVSVTNDFQPTDPGQA